MFAYTDTFPASNRNVSIFVFGNFKKDISRNATTWFFLNANNGELAGWGGGGFCNHTTVVQTIDGLTGPGCPAVAGSAFLRSDLFIDEIWPAVSDEYSTLGTCYWFKQADMPSRVHGISMLMSGTAQTPQRARPRDYSVLKASSRFNVRVVKAYSVYSKRSRLDSYGLGGSGKALMQVFEICHGANGSCYVLFVDGPV